MKTRVLGRTGFVVSEVGLGAWQFGGSAYGPVSPSDACATVEHYLSGGGNFIDTARGYGESERILGGFFREHGGREKVFLASKSPRNEAAALQSDLEASLRALQTEYIDLYYLHDPPDDPAAMNRVLDTCERLKQTGKIRAIGASIKGPDVTDETVRLCRQYIRSGRVDALMVIYSLLRQKNAEMLREAMVTGVGIVARTVLENGFLTGRYAPGHAFTMKNDHRARWGSRRLKAILEEVRDLTAWAVVPPYQTMTQVALRFVLRHEAVSNAVIGVRSLEQVNGIMEADSLPPLSPEICARLEREYGGRTAEFNTGE